MTRSSLVDGQQTTNGGKTVVEAGLPYIATVEVRGVAPLLMHNWNSEAVAEKSASAKGSKAKKSDNLESYCYRLPDGRLGVPGMNMAAALCEAARYRQDPRSPRKSMRDLVRAAIVPLDVVAPFLPDRTQWDYEDSRRVAVQRAGVTRVRPAMKEGWRLRFTLLVNVPEYVSVEVLHSLCSAAGRLVGLCDFRPTYGRFEVSHFETGSALGE